MGVEENKRKAILLYDEINAATKEGRGMDLAVLKQVIAPNWVYHGPGGKARGDLLPVLWPGSRCPDSGLLLRRCGF